jgi:hypothetical protein
MRARPQSPAIVREPHPTAGLDAAQHGSLFDDAIAVTLTSFSPDSCI